MYELFKLPAIPVTRGFYKPPTFDNINRYVQDQYTKLQKFYREFPPVTHTDRVVGKLLTDIKVPVRGDWIDIYDRVTDDTARLAGLNGMVSALSNGQVTRKGEFLPKGSREIIVAMQFPVDLSDLKNTWQDLQPVRWLYHNSTDLNMPLLGSRKALYLADVGDLPYGVVAIDVGMLAVKYHCWRHYHVSKMRTDAKPNKGQFIGSFILPDMIPSFHDIALFNRVVNIVKRKPIPVVGRTHSVATYRLDTQIDKILKQSIDYITRKRLMEWDEVFRYIPSFFNTNLFKGLCLPSVPSTIQLDWVLELSRLPMISWALYMMREEHVYPDRSFINEVRYDTKTLLTRNVLATRLRTDWPDMRKWIQQHIKDYL